MSVTGWLTDYNYDDALAALQISIPAGEEARPCQTSTPANDIRCGQYLRQPLAKRLKDVRMPPGDVSFALLTYFNLGPQIRTRETKHHEPPG
jgi:hypothetical protein